ncbi:MAG: chloride channel protein, partial [Desulfobulbaceae bacterium]|nr:chloride channel protein [Desulfobulbaceae bacterium]
MPRQSVQQYIGPLALALAIGMLAGLGAVLFRELLDFFQQILWPAGKNFTDQIQQADLWQRLLIPTVVGLLAGPVITFWAPEVRGPGVPEVIEALALRGGRIRHRVTVIKTFITAGLIAAGGSLGREGPIVQIGSSIGSSLTQLFGLGPDSRRLAVACGAAAG